jgi:hypothetical protein
MNLKPCLVNQQKLRSNELKELLLPKERQDAQS